MLTRTPASETSSPSWKVKRGIRSSPGLNFAAKVFTWMETYGRIRQKDGAIVPFHMNAIQIVMAHFVAECWHASIPVLCAIVKARQQGSSTFWDMLAVALAELKPGYQAAIVAHDDEGAGILFQKVDVALRHLERAGWPRGDLLADQGMLRRWTTESMVGAGTIKTGDALGKGATPNMFHWSECASYSDKGNNAAKAVVSAKSGQVLNQWTIEVFESTANGKDPFFFPMCEEAADHDSDSPVHLFFFGWFLTPEYSMSWTDYRKTFTAIGKRDPGPAFVPTPDETSLRERLATTTVEPHERHFRYRVTLSDDQLIWRRHALATICKGDRNELARYFPSFYEECFTASTVCFFEPETVHLYRVGGKPPIATGTLVLSPTPTFVPTDSPRPVLLIWDFPKPYHSYVIGADPGGERVDRDPSQAYVVDTATREVVARCGGHLSANDFTSLLFNLGVYYNKALLVVENNFNPTVANELHRLGYTNLYYYFADAKVEAKVGKVPGFSTNLKTRPEILGNLRSCAAVQSIRNPDPEFWKEMETFVWVPKSGSLNPEREGKFQAVGKNHDDRIMALALALFQCPDGTSEVKPPVPEEGPTRAWQFYQSVMNKEAPSGVLL